MDLQKPTKKRKKSHISFGIKNWLNSKGWLDDKYEELIKEFCESRTGWDPSLVKSYQSYERYIDNNFHTFCVWCGNKKSNK